MSEWSERPLAKRQEFLRRFADKNDVGMCRELITPLVAPEGRGFFTCLGPMFRSAIFGRDSIKMAEDMLPLGNRNLATGELNEFGQLSYRVILTLAELQGVRDDPVYSEEAPGKIHHEYRHRKFSSDPNVQNIITMLRESKQWMPPESDTDVLCYYGSVDATPLYIRLVRDFVARFGGEVLSDVVLDKNGNQKTIAQSVSQAADYLYDEIGRCPSGLLEWRRTNAQGLVSQTWKDSPDGFLHLDGSRANYEGGVAAVDVQAYTFDALRAAGEMLPRHHHSADWIHRADDLRQRTLFKLWLPGKGYVAQGLDYDDNGQSRQIATMTSDAAMLLGSGMLDASLGYLMAREVERQINSSEFQTPVGVRLRALGHTALEKYLCYHGSRVCWDKETGDVIKSFESQGLRADHMSEAIIHGCIESGDCYEFRKVDEDGMPRYHYGSEGAAMADFEDGDAHDPQSWQGWSVTAFIRAVHRRHKPLA